MKTMCSATLPDPNGSIFFLSMLTSARDSFHVGVKVTASTLCLLCIKGLGENAFHCLSLAGWSEQRPLKHCRNQKRCHCSNLQGKEKGKKKQTTKKCRACKVWMSFEHQVTNVDKVKKRVAEVN